MAGFGGTNSAPLHYPRLRKATTGLELTARGMAQSQKATEIHLLELLELPQVQLYYPAMLSSVAKADAAKG